MSPDPSGNMRQWGNHKDIQRQGRQVSSQDLGQWPPSPLASPPELAAEEAAWCDSPIGDRPSWLVSVLTCLHCFFRNGNPDREQEAFLKLHS